MKHKREMESLKIAQEWMYYEQQKGTHTYSLCDCGRTSCRSIKCVLCWKEEIQKLQKKVKK